MLMKITSLKARQILDSRGIPTLEVDCQVRGSIYTAAVPSGASTGVHEALELRDGGKRLFGKSVMKAVKNVSVLSKVLKGKDCRKQQQIDSLLIQADGTTNKRKLGANALLGASLAVCRAGADQANLSLFKHIQNISKTKRAVLPVPYFNIINGGRHAGNELAVQEFMIAPVKAKKFSDALWIGAEVYQTLKILLKKKYGVNAINVGDEGGFAPNLKKTTQALDLVTKAIEKAGYVKEVKIAMDVAASEFYEAGTYFYDGRHITHKKLLDELERLCTQYPIISVEDPFDQEDFVGFAELTRRIGKKVQVVGDDLLVTNLQRLRMGLHYGSCNALLLKVNQIGTVSESIAASQLANLYDWNVMVSHRSGETTDDFIADLVVGLGTGQLKSGAPCRGERVAKYNRLLRIEEELGSRARYGR